MSENFKLARFWEEVNANKGKTQIQTVVNNITIDDPNADNADNFESRRGTVIVDNPTVIQEDKKEPAVKATQETPNPNAANRASLVANNFNSFTSNSDDRSKIKMIESDN